VNSKMLIKTCILTPFKICGDLKFLVMGVQFWSKIDFYFTNLDFCTLCIYLYLIPHKKVRLLFESSKGISTTFLNLSYQGEYHISINRIGSIDFSH